MNQPELQIARLDAGDCVRFQTDFRLQRPAILVEGSRNWPDTLFRWEHLAARFAAQQVLTYRLPPESPAPRLSAIRSNFYVWTDKEGDRIHLRQWSFGEFLAELQNGSAHYCMANNNKNAQLRDMLAAEAGNLDCDPVAGARPDPARCEFFIGSENTGPGLHHDGAVESFLCQLIGAKRINVFSPADAPYLYPVGSVLASSNHFSAVADSFDVDGAAFPLFARATVNRCELDPGDVLYLPPGWYHDPCSTGPGAMMTIRSIPPARNGGAERGPER